MTTTHRTALGLALAATLLIGAACDNGKADQEASTKASATANAVDQDVGKTPEAPAPDPAATATTPAAPALTVKLIDAGQEPRRPLRFALVKGSKHHAEMKMKMRMEMDMGMGMQSMPIPMMSMPMDVTITDVMPDGYFRYDFVMGKPSVVPGKDDNPAMVDQLSTMLASMAGLSGYAVVSATGIPRDADVKVPAGVPPQVSQMLDGMRDSLKQLAAPLPEEPVGTGARWQVNMTISQNGMTMKQVVDYTLTGTQGDRLKVHADIVQSADPQVVKAPGMPPGATASLKEFTGSGTGDSDIALDRPFPVSANIASNVSMVMGVEQGAQKVSVSTKVGVDVTLESR